jgi:hypothetical protein
MTYKVLTQVAGATAGVQTVLCEPGVCAVDIRFRVHRIWKEKKGHKSLDHKRYRANIR